MNIFNFFRNRRERKARKQALAQTSAIFGYLKVLFDKNLLMWEESKRQLFITQPIAVVMIGKGMDAFRNFLNNIFLYLSYTNQQQAYEQHILMEQHKAIKARAAKGIALKPGETDRIRRAVRAKLKPEDVPAPKIEPLDFVIIDDNTEGDAQAAVTFVGDYNPDTGSIDMAAWDDIKQAFATTPTEEK